MTHQCAAPNCAKLIRSHLLMCPGHWVRVPLSIQRNVNNAWHRLTSPGLAPQSRRTAYDAYRHWRSIAIDSVTKKPITPSPAMLNQQCSINNAQ